MSTSPTSSTASSSPVTPRGLVPRLADHASSVFGEFSALAVKLEAVNLGQGFPDPLSGPARIREAVLENIRTGIGDQYPPAHGDPLLRAAVAAHQKRFYGIDIDPVDGVVVATGASEVLCSTILALIDEGDEVIVLDPAFDVYSAVIDMARGVRVSVPLTVPDFRLDPEVLRAKVSARTKMILVNTPHNPTGSVLTAAELEQIAAVAIEHDLIVLADEVYEHLVFDDHRHVPIATLPGMAERTITVGSAGKSFSFTGWKVGWASGPADLIASVRVVRQHLSYVSGGPFQRAFALGLEFPDDYWAEMRATMQAGRDRLTTGLHDLGFGITPAAGSYFAVTDVRPWGYRDGLEFCRDIPHRAGVVAIPVQVFAADPEPWKPFVRWTFCKSPEVLDEALRRLAAART